MSWKRGAEWPDQADGISGRQAGHAMGALPDILIKKCQSPVVGLEHAEGTSQQGIV